MALTPINKLIKPRLMLRNPFERCDHHRAPSVAANTTSVEMAPVDLAYRNTQM